MRSLLIAVLVAVSLAALAFNLVANGMDHGYLIPPPKCGNPQCNCGCLDGDDCRCAE